MIELELPYPPSANNYWRKFNNRMVISEKGTEYRDCVGRIVAESGLQKINGAIAVKRILFCPDWRRRDSDNTTKALYDALGKAGIWDDDSFICIEVAEKRRDADGIGRVIVQIKEVQDAIERKTGAWLK